MKRVKTWIILILLISLFLFVNGCSKQNDPSEKLFSDSQLDSMQSEFAEVRINSDSLFYQMALIDNKILYTEINGQTLDFVLEDPYGEQLKFGCVSNFFTSMKQSVLEYPFFYHYISVVGEDNITRNCLIKLNVETGDKEEYLCEDEAIPGIPTYLFNGCIVTYKNVVTDDKIVTFIDSFNIETKTWERHMECTVDSISGQGEAIYGICSDQQYLYVLHDVCESKSEFKSYLEILDTNYSTVKTIIINQELHDYVLSNFVSDMDVYGEYIYFFNASMYGYLAKIDGDELKEVFKGRDFAIAKNIPSSAPLFYIRGTNNVYYLDDSGELRKEELQIGNDQVLQTIFVYDDLCYVIFYGDEINAYSYIVSRESLGVVMFPCPGKTEEEGQ